MRKEILNRVFSFAENYVAHDTAQQTYYLKYGINIEKRNITLLAVPEMFKHLTGKRQFLAEEHINLYSISDTEIDFEKIWEESTFPRHSIDYEYNVKKYYPHIYNEAIFGKDVILSPFRKCNKIYYKYDIIHSEKATHLYFRPFQKHISLIEGMAEIDFQTGRIMSVQFDGADDLIIFRMTMTMNQNGKDSLTTVDADFKFLGNRINNQYALCPTPTDVVRPIALTQTEIKLKEEYDSLQTTQMEQDSLKEHKSKGSFSRTLKTIGDAAWGDTRSQSGNTSMSLSPLFNPFMMSYSQSKGLAYRLKFNLTHDINTNNRVNFDVNLGYNFKQEQFYLNIPVYWHYNREKERSFMFEFTRGDRLASAVVTEYLEYFDPDSITDDDIDYYIDSHIKIANTRRYAKNLLGTIGFSYHRRYAVNPQFFELMGIETHFDNFAPYINLTYRFPNQGPVVRFDYEQGIEDVLGSYNSFTRLELDASYKKKLRSIRTLSLRAGVGKYFAPSDYAFMDYENFRDNNLPEGWNDDWTGEFQMLNSYKYNISDYYFRGNATYESPLLILYWLPFVGRYIETERIYFNILDARSMHPYMEIGYGIKNRFISGALYVNLNELKFKGMEFKINVELFNN